MNSNIQIILFRLYFLLGIFLGLILYFKNYEFSTYDLIAYFSVMIFLLKINLKKENIKVEKKVKDLYNSISNEDFKKFKEIIKTEFNDDIQKVQECCYHVLKIIY